MLVKLWDNLKSTWVKSDPLIIPQKFVQAVAVETKWIDWELCITGNIMEGEELQSLLKPLSFEAGKQLGLPSKWLICLKSFSESNPKETKYLSIYVRKCKENVSSELSKEYVAKFVATLVHPSNPKENVKRGCAPQDFGDCEGGWGVRQLVKLEDLPKFQDATGRFKISIEFCLYKTTQVETTEGAKFREIQEKSANQLYYDIVCELNREHSKNVEIIPTTGEPFLVNKLILQARSPKFREALLQLEQNNDMLEKGQRQNILKIKVKQPEEITKYILCYMHTGRLPEQILNTNEIDIDLALQLYLSAKELQLDLLVTFLSENYPGLKERLDEGADSSNEEGGEKQKMGVMRRFLSAASHSLFKNHY